MPNYIELTVACLSIVAAVLGGVQYLINNTVKKELAIFEVSIVKRINGTYIRTAEWDEWLEQRKLEREHMYDKLTELKSGLEYIRRRYEERL